MKTRLSISLLVTGMMISGICHAQSIVGKWARTSMKMVTIEKATGKRQDMSSQTQQMVERMKETIEFKSDKTWIRTVTYGHSPKGMSLNGTYTFTGNQLKTKLDPVLAEKFEKAAAELKKNPKYRSNSNGGLPDAITLKSLTGSTMVWSYTGDRIGNEEMSKKYSVEEEVTYTKQ